MQREDHPDVLAQLLRRTRTRLRINDAVRAFARGLPLLLIIACVTVAVRKLTSMPALSLSLACLAGVAAVLLVVSTAHAAFRRAPWQRAALVVDRHYALHDRLTSALEFQRRPAHERSTLMSLCIEQATVTARDLDIRRAVPVKPPRELAYSVVLLGLALVIGRLEAHAPIVPAVVQQNDSVGFVAEADDLELMRELASEWQQTANSPQGREVAQRFNQLVMDIAGGKLDRHQVLDRLQALQQSLTPLDPEQQAALDEALQGLARALESNPDTKRLGNALNDRNLTDAEQALRELAGKLKNKKDFDPKRLEELRKALQAAASQNAQRSERLAAERASAEQARERLLKKKQAGESTNDSQSALSRQERQLEQLRREQRKAEQAQQQMTELDRQLAEAARRLFEEMGESAQSLQAGADELKRMQQQQLTEQEKEALKKQLEALREMLRQQGKAGESQRGRQREFARRARGQDPAAGGAQSQPRAGLALVPGSGAAGVETPARQAGQSQAGSQPSDQHGAGTDPNLKGNASTLKGQTQDVTAAGIDTGQGPSASSVVFGAAQRGFVGGDYKRVYSEYKTVAEETLEQDRVPAGYEGHVRRYFQLIRPRD